MLAKVELLQNTVHFFSRFTTTKPNCYTTETVQWQ